MKLITDATWFRALRGLRRPQPAGPDAADMGTAFGLDSITIVNPADTTREPRGEDTGAGHDWHRRLVRRSRF